MKIILTNIIFCTIVLLFLTTQSAFASPCPYEGKEISEKQLHTILKYHNELINNHSDTIEALDGNVTKIKAFKKILEADTRYANLCSANLIKHSFVGANLYAANLDGALLSNTDFENANLENASLIKSKLSYANLTNAKMSGANLEKANLHHAKIIKTVLFNANLSHADLSNSRLHEAKLSDANLAGANLANAQLTKTFLSYSNLTSANFNKSDLTGAILKDADLTNALFNKAILKNIDLEGANISNVNFDNTDLRGVNYLPKTNTYPNMGSLFQNKTLHLLTYHHNSSGLYQLRNKFKKLGFRNAERKLTYAIRHTRHSKITNNGIIKNIDKYFNTVFFEFPTDWSMHPEKALILLMVLIFIFSLPYSISVYKPGSDGIWRMWNNKRIRQDLGHNEAKLISVGLFKSILIGFQFSVLSAFHIGWKDLNVGNWISRIQPREYSLYATGWVRTVSGLQSLISVYLTAAWALTYFGRPFE